MFKICIYLMGRALSGLCDVLCGAWNSDPDMATSLVSE